MDKGGKAERGPGSKAGKGHWREGGKQGSRDREAMATHEWHFNIMKPLSRSERHARRTDGRRALRSIAGTYPAQRGAGKGAVGDHRRANTTPPHEWQGKSADTKLGECEKNL